MIGKSVEKINTRSLPYWLCSVSRDGVNPLKNETVYKVTLNLDASPELGKFNISFVYLPRMEKIHCLKDWRFTNGSSCLINSPRIGCASHKAVRGMVQLIIFSTKDVRNIRIQIPSCEGIQLVESLKKDQYSNIITFDKCNVKINYGTNYKDKILISYEEDGVKETAEGTINSIVEDVELLQ